MNEALDLGGRLRALRRRAGLSQVELAALLGVHGMTISRWERGEGEPGGGLVPVLLDALRRASIGADATIEAVGDALRARGVESALRVLFGGQGG